MRTAPASTILLAALVAFLPAAAAGPVGGSPGLLPGLDATKAAATTPLDPLLLPVLPGLDDEPAGPEPSSMGQVIVGFTVGALPAVQPGEQIEGYTVLSVVPNGDYLVVSAMDVGEVRRAMGGVAGLVYVEDDLPLSSRILTNDPRLASQYGVPQTHVDEAWGLAP